jgi:hypothetical protein
MSKEIIATPKIDKKGGEINLKDGRRKNGHLRMLEFC